MMYSIAVVIGLILCVNPIVGTVYAEEQVNQDIMIQSEALSLEQALELTYANNLNLKVAEADMISKNLSVSQQSKIAKDDANTGNYDSDLAKGFYPSITWTYRYAEQDYNKAQHQYQQTKLTQEKNLRQAYLNVDGSIEAIKMLERSVENLAESYKISMLQYELDLLTRHDLKNVRLSLENMENDLLNAQLNYQLAEAQLEYTSGYSSKSGK